MKGNLIFMVPYILVLMRHIKKVTILDVAMMNGIASANSGLFFIKKLKIENNKIKKMPPQAYGKIIFFIFLSLKKTIERELVDILKKSNQTATIPM